MVRRGYVPFVLVCASAISLPAQQSYQSASLGGRVTDPTGEGIAGATVTLFQRSTFTSQSASSDSTGMYRFTHLANGQYELTVQKPDFRATTRSITLHSDETADLSVSLSNEEKKSARLQQNLIFEAPSISATPTLSISKLSPSPATSEDADEPAAVLEGLSGIQQFRILNNQPSSSGWMQVPDPTGLSAVHGTLYGMIGSQLIGYNRLQSPFQLPLMTYGASLGGSFNNNRTAYSIGFDRDSLDQRRLLAMFPSSLHQVGSADGASALRDPVGSSVTSSQFLARLSHRLDNRNSMDIAYKGSEMAGNSLQNNGMRPSLGLNTSHQSGSVSDTFTVSPNTLNEVRGQFTSGSVQVPAGQSGDAIQADAATMRRFRVYEAADNVYHQMGKQTFRAGGNFLYNQMSVSFLEGRLGNPQLGQSSRGAGGYVLNQWKVTPDLVFTAGARYDLQFLKKVRTDTNNFGPQVGFAWSPAGLRSTVIRGGYGVIYERIPLPAISGAFDSGSAAVNLLGSASFTPGLNSSSLHTLGSSSTISPSMQNSYMEDASLEIEQQIGSRSSVTAAFQHVNGVQLARPTSIGADLCAGTNANGGCDVTSVFQGGLEYDSGAHSSYDGFSLAFAQHPVRWGDYRIAYTYATARSSMGQSYESMAGDQMKRVSGGGSLHTSMEPGTNLWQHFSRGISFTGYGDITRRNDLPGLDLINLRARLVKNYQLGARTHLECFAETFNMLKRRNYSLSQAREDLGEYGATILQSYEHFATLTNPSGSQLGLRLKF